MCILASGHVRADPSLYSLLYFVSMWLNHTCTWYKGQANTENDPSAILCCLNRETMNNDFPGQDSCSLNTSFCVVFKLI